MQVRAAIMAVYGSAKSVFAVTVAVGVSTEPPASCGWSGVGEAALTRVDSTLFVLAEGAWAAVTVEGGFHHRAQGLGPQGLASADAVGR